MDVVNGGEETAAWCVYIIQADDGALYTGITSDMEKRWMQHMKMAAGGRKGAKFFRARKPELLVFYRPGFDRASATRYEIAVKKLSRSKKLELIRSDRNLLESASFTPPRD